MESDEQSVGVADKAAWAMAGTRSRSNCFRPLRRPPYHERPMARDFPTAEMELTHLLVVRDLDRARTFYRDVLGAEVYREYGGTSAVLRFVGAWLLLVTGGGPTPDKPDVMFAPPVDPSIVSHEMTIRVPDCRAAYAILQSRGAEFLTPPVESAWEVRCFFRDPDGHLLELSQAKTPP